MKDEEKDIKATEEETESSENKNAENADETSVKTEMPPLQEGIAAGLEDTDVSNQVREAFLDYAMSVIVSRAIPDVRDGLKPVHRRVIYGMDQANIYPTRPHVKCARIVGDVMGKYHPHGDAAIYSTLVRLAQPFAMRYILVDGHGNFGDIDGDEAAAMRYTEARMSKLAVEMVRDIDKNTVDLVDNYDGNEKEPVVLPSRFPNLLVNGSSGIAVGMATNIPTHNLGECIDAAIAVAQNPEITPLEIMEQYMPGPDFPTGATILGRSGIKEAYENGTGSIIIRSKARIDEKDSGKKQIIVSEIPYQVNKARLVSQINDLQKNKVVEGITGVRDESNKEGIRIVIDVRHDAVPEVVLNQLYKLTPLQTSYGIIMLCLDGGAPHIYPVNKLLSCYVEHQIQVIERRTKYLLKQDEDRDHILVGLVKAQENIDDVVEIIRKSATPEEATKKLMQKYDFTEVQTNAILAMTLRRLTGLEKQKLLDERAEVEKRIKEYKHILESRENEIEVMVKELTEVKEKFADERRTEISDAEGNIDDESLIPQKEVVVILTKNNYVKRVTSDTFRTQNRGGRGVRGVTTNDEDLVSILLHTKTHTDLLFFTNLGKVYRLRGYQVPEGGRNSKGIPAQNLLNLEKSERVMSIIDCPTYEEGKFLFFATIKGIVKRTALSEFASIRQNGKIALSFHEENDQLLDVKLTDGNAIIGLANEKGKMCNFKETDVRIMGRNAGGVKGIDTPDSKVVSLTTSLEGNIILALTKNGFGKMSHSEDYRLTCRGAKGVLTLNATAKNGKLVAVRAVKGDEDLMIITDKGTIIRISLTQVKISGRNTQGVRVIRLDPGQHVSSLAIIPHEDADQSVPESAPAEQPAEEDLAENQTEAPEQTEEETIDPDKIAD